MLLFGVGLPPLVSWLAPGESLKIIGFLASTWGLASLVPSYLPTPSLFYFIQFLSCPSLIQALSIIVRCPDETQTKSLPSRSYHLINLVHRVCCSIQRRTSGSCAAQHPYLICNHSFPFRHHLTGPQCMPPGILDSMGQTRHDGVC